MSSQKLLLVDRKDNLIGYADREQCHLGKGKRHRAFVTLLFDSKGNVLLQRRRHELFDGLWDLTAISHPYKKNGKHKEGLIEAANRALRMEMGIGEVKLKNVGTFTYFASDGKWCENEYCHILTGNYSGRFKPNKKLVYDAKKIKFGNFVKDIAKNPKKYTPWARLAAEKLIADGILQQELRQFLTAYEPYVRKYFDAKVKSTAKYSPQIAKFYKDLADFSSRGKKLRAFLVYLGYKIGGGENLGRILPISLAFEMTQSFLLIHDDIIDNADLRRGKPTIHKIWAKKLGEEYGRAMAIVLGDIVCLEIFDLVNSADFKPEAKVKCVQNLVKVLLETAYGQTMDIHNAYRVPTLGEIYKVTDLKSARYSFVGPLTLGAVFSDAGKAQIAAIEDFGLKAGLAFQIHDDILGVFGDEKTIGKSVFSDMREGKNTVLIHKTKEMSKDSKLERIWGNRKAGARELRQVREIIEASGARKWCRMKNARLIEAAKKYIPKITKDENLRQILGQVADFSVSRQK